MKTSGLISFLFIFLMAFQAEAQRYPKKTSDLNITARAGTFIDVNSPAYAQSSYTIEQLVQNVLVSGTTSCGGVISNISVSPNLAAANAERSWGYFNKGTASFPFAEGVILSTGFAVKAGNSPIATDLDDHLNTGTDADLATALQVNPLDLRDATYIQFDFVPTSNSISFQYLMASEEYQSDYPCRYTDGFALLIKKVTDPNYQNLAIIPGTNQPVSITNIHPALSGASSTCAASNVAYFNGFNTNPLVETNFSGRTIPMTATAAVEPGVTYRFKMVLADYGDRDNDTAVFLQSGGFNLGIRFMDANGNTLGSSIPFCLGGSQILQVSSAASGASFQWTLNGNVIPGATSSTYTATQPGVYGVSVTVNGVTCPQTASITLAGQNPPTANPASLSLCNSGNGQATFDLTSTQSTVNGGTGLTYSYYQTLSDAQSGNANTIQNPAAYSSGSGQVFVRVSNGQCTAVSAITLTLKPLPPTPVITASATQICGTSNVTLTSNSTTGNLWSNGATTPSITVTSPGIYTVTNTQNGCTSAAASVTITGDADPNLQITGSTTVCVGSTTTLTAATNGTPAAYLWSNGATTPSINVGTAGSYSVTVTMPGGCQFTKTVTVSTTTTPTAGSYAVNRCTLTGSDTLNLTSFNANISTTSGAQFSYYENQADAVAGNTNTIPNPTAYAVTGTHTVYVRVANGTCVAVGTLQIQIGTTPVAQITASAPTICGGTAVTLTSASPTGNSWSNGSTAQSITVSAAGTYTLTVTNGQCASTPASIVIGQEANPNLSISGALNFCQNSTTTLTANAAGVGNTFLWSTGATTPQITVTTPGNYSVTVTTAGGCTYTQSVNVTQEAVANITIATPVQITCNTPTVTLNAASSTIPAGATILWTATNGGHIVSGANTLTPTVDQAGTYTLNVTNANGLHCSTSQSVPVLKNTTPPGIQLTASKLSICLGESVTLTAVGGQTYTWTGLSGNGDTQTVTPTQTTIYTVTGVGANGCQGNVVSVTVNVVPAIVSTLKDVRFCDGETITLDAGSGPNYTYLWNTGATTQTIRITKPGTYTVTIKNGSCTRTFEAVATLYPVPEIKEIRYENKTLTILPVTAGNYEYSIDNALSWQTSNTFTNINPNRNYRILIREAGANCYATVDYFTFSMPNAITPNNDGINDFVDFTFVSRNPEFQAAVYDRQGAMVFQAKPGNSIWRGQFLEGNVQTGTYWYQASWLNPYTGQPVNISGWILVKNF